MAVSQSDIDTDVSRIMSIIGYSESEVNNIYNQAQTFFTYGGPPHVDQATSSLFRRQLSDQFYYNQIFKYEFFDPIYDMFSTTIESFFDDQLSGQFYYDQLFNDNRFFDPVYDMFLATIESFFGYQFSDQIYSDEFYGNEAFNPTYDMFLTMIECFLDDRFPDQFLDMGSTTNVGDGLSEETIATHLKTSNSPKKEGELCAVCLDDLSRFDKKSIIGSLDCGHEYHEGCIKQWLTRKNCCPLCKATGISV
ncbi:hypothetical protein CASFOL_031324 [Castilleja foliolosa]|uniref:RING-type E3 ubiquitin transferase n=1 Tax=Castilleja foliolosa TaxID=1961234 RepID=A0ABD3C6A2_9LAMI